MLITVTRGLFDSSVRSSERRLLCCATAVLNMLVYALTLLTTLLPAHAAHLDFTHCVFTDAPPCASTHMDVHVRANEIDLSSHMASPPGRFAFAFRLGSPITDHAYASSPVAVFDFSYDNAHITRTLYQCYARLIDELHVYVAFLDCKPTVQHRHGPRPPPVSRRRRERAERFALSRELCSRKDVFEHANHASRRAARRYTHLLDAPPPRRFLHLYPPSEGECCIMGGSRPGGKRGLLHLRCTYIPLQYFFMWYIMLHLQLLLLPIALPAILLLVCVPPLLHTARDCRFHLLYETDFTFYLAVFFVYFLGFMHGLFRFMFDAAFAPLSTLLYYSTLLLLRLVSPFATLARGALLCTYRCARVVALHCSTSSLRLRDGSTI